MINYCQYYEYNRKCWCSGSGEIEFEEFCILAAKFLTATSDEEDGYVNQEELTSELKEAFRFYDKEGRAYILST